MIQSIGNMFFIAGMFFAILGEAIALLFAGMFLYFIITAVDLMVDFNLTKAVAILVTALIAAGVSNA